MEGCLFIYTLGGLKIQKGEEVVAGLETRKVEALLVYLAATRRVHSRDSLAELFWEERSQQQSLSNLRVALASLRKHLGEYLEVSRESVGLRPGAEVWLDAAEIEKMLAGDRRWRPPRRPGSSIKRSSFTAANSWRGFTCATAPGSRAGRYASASGSTTWR